MSDTLRYLLWVLVGVVEGDSLRGAVRLCVGGGLPAQLLSGGFSQGRGVRVQHTSDSTHGVVDSESRHSRKLKIPVAYMCWAVAVFVMASHEYLHVRAHCGRACASRWCIGEGQFMLPDCKTHFAI
jgi:hypothetical protein